MVQPPAVPSRALGYRFEKAMLIQTIEHQTRGDQTQFIILLHSVAFYFFWHENAN